MTNLKTGLLVLALFGMTGCIETTIPASAPTMPSDDLSAFQGARAGQAEGGLQARGYQLARTEGLTAFWFNQGTGSCARIVTSNGRYESVTMVPASNC
ncbi:hypothetical protein [Roseibaca sp. Y0-43]|uniref:hypothetical protein n=1 Tax=Roseibaca sp. Y0-43 TaxID=2816854 RepID=UPI001D0C988B|nr:hypothetical protein [Roseibaca sp. Y0-43]MCC1480779.1 hypothetical protein [Roseibaca sp. Y0-43]